VGDAGKYYASLGKEMYVKDRGVAEGSMRAKAGAFTLSGDGHCVGYERGDA